MIEWRVGDQCKAAESLVDNQQVSQFLESLFERLMRVGKGSPEQVTVPENVGTDAGHQGGRAHLVQTMTKLVKDLGFLGGQSP